jgi:integrase
MLDQAVRGDVDAITLKAADKHIYCRALEALRPYKVRLDTAVFQIVEVYKALEGIGASPGEVARDYAKRNRVKLPDKTVSEVVTEFIQTKERENRSARYIEDLRYRLGCPDAKKVYKRGFATAFQTNIARIDGADVRAFLDALNLSGRSYNNFRGAIISLFEFAKGRKYLRADWDELSAIGTIKDNGGDIEIFTPEEMAGLLTHASDQLVPFLAIGAFAGLRSAEIDRLDWREVKMDTGYIVVEKGKAKTAARRVVPMADNLKVWLHSYAKKQGKVWPHGHAYLYELLQDVAAKAKVEWKQNALRHSYISYRVADGGDVNRTALESGNSPAMIFSNYRELVTPSEAKRWFSIKPGAAGEDKVLWLKAA